MLAHQMMHWFAMFVLLALLESLESLEMLEMLAWAAKASGAEWAKLAAHDSLSRPHTLRQTVGSQPQGCHSGA